MPSDLDAVSAVVRRAIAETFGVPEASIGDATVADDVDRWDSVSSSMLFLNIEEMLDVQLPIERLIEASNVGDLCARIAAHLHETSAIQSGTRDRHDDA